MTSSALWSAPSTSLISNKDWQFIPEISTLTDIHLILYWLIGISVLVVISGGLLVYLRHEPYIRHRSLTLSLMMLVICALLIFYSISRQTLPMDGSGCYINYLVLGTLMPTWVVTYGGRVLNLLILFLDSEIRWRRSNPTVRSDRSMALGHVNLRRHSGGPINFVQELAATANKADHTMSAFNASNSHTVNTNSYDSDNRLWRSLSDERRAMSLDAAYDSELQTAMELCGATRSARAMKTRSAYVNGTKAATTTTMGSSGGSRHVGRPLSAASACSLKAQFTYDDQVSGVSHGPYTNKRDTIISMDSAPTLNRFGMRWMTSENSNSSYNSRWSGSTQNGPLPDVNQNIIAIMFTGRVFIDLVREYRYYLTLRWILYYVVTIILLQTTIVMAFWHFSAPIELQPYETCFNRWQFVAVELTTDVLSCILIPFSFWSLYYSRDVFGMRLEMLLLWSIQLPFQISIRILQFVPGLAVSARRYAYLVMAIGIFIAYIITIIYPIILAFMELQRKSHDTSELAFRALLQNPAELELLKNFTVMEFTVENVLFYHRCARDLARIYVTFVRQNAGYQVQLDVVTREYIEERFARGTADASVFDQAVEQVIQQMYSKTFPRFLDWRASRKRRWPQLCGYQNIQLPEQQEIYYQ